MVSRALDCIDDNLYRIHDSYATSLVTYTLVLANHPKAGVMMTRLKNKAIRSKGEGSYSLSLKMQSSIHSAPK